MTDGLAARATSHRLDNDWPLKGCLAWLINQSHHWAIRWPRTRAQKQTKQKTPQKKVPLIAAGVTFLQTWLNPLSRPGRQKPNLTHPSQAISHHSHSNETLGKVRPRGNQNTFPFVPLNIHHMPSGRGNEVNRRERQWKGSNKSFKTRDVHVIQ